MITARVQIASTSSSRWVEMMIAFSAAIARDQLAHRECFWLGSRPSVGSSMISTGGSCRIACARPDAPLEALGQRLDGLVEHGCDFGLLHRAAHPRLRLGTCEPAHFGDEGQELARRHVGIGGRALGQIADRGLRGDDVRFDIVAADADLPSLGAR